MSGPNPVLLCGPESEEVLKENMIISVDIPMFPGVESEFKMVAGN